MKDSGQLLQIVHAGMVKAGLDVRRDLQPAGLPRRAAALRQMRTAHAAAGPVLARLVESRSAAIPRSACTCARTCRCSAARCSNT